MKNDLWISLMTFAPDDVVAEAARELLGLADDAVQLTLDCDGADQQETWMIDGDYEDAMVLAIPREGPAVVGRFDDESIWPLAMLAAVAAAKNAYYSGEAKCR